MSKTLFQAIRSDVRRELGFLKRRTPLTATWVILFGKGLHIMYVYRLFSWAYRALVKNKATWRLIKPLFEVAYRVTAFFVYNFKGIEIPYQATIGPGLRLVHPYSIILAPQTSIGENCTIFHDVSCGVNHLDRSGYPRIGDNVVLYPGARVIGNVAVGSTVIVGANSVVVRDIPSNSIAVGAPAEAKKKIDSLDILGW